MTAVAADWPIRCAMVVHATGRVCSQPAVAAVITELTCGCPPIDDVTCQGCVDNHPLGLEQWGECTVCESDARGTVTRHRPLNEGDLP